MTQKKNVQIVARIAGHSRKASRGQYTNAKILKLSNQGNANKQFHTYQINRIFFLIQELAKLWGNGNIFW